MRDEGLIALVDANLEAFARHLAGSTHAGVLEVQPVAAAVIGRRGRGYGLWTRAHADVALEAILPTAGFSLVVDLPVMVLEARPAPASTPVGTEIRQVVDQAGAEDFRLADGAGLAGLDLARASIAPVFRDVGSLIHPDVAAFVAYVDGVPVAAAMSFTALTVARVGSVGTVPALRRRGLGRAVTRAAVLAGFDRGATLAALESSPSGVGLYRAMGFRTVTSYRLWSID